MGLPVRTAFKTARGGGIGGVCLGWQIFQSHGVDGYEILLEYTLWYWDDGMAPPDEFGWLGYHEAFRIRPNR